LLAAALRLASTHLTSRKPNLRNGRRTVPARSGPVRTLARRIAQAAAAQAANRDHIWNRAAAHSVTTPRAPWPI